MRNWNLSGRTQRGFAPHPTRAVTALDPHLAKILAWVKRAIFASRWEIRKIGRFWPKKAGKILRGKACFPLRDYSPAFPGCKASGLAALSGRARSTKPSCRTIFLHLTAGGCFLSLSGNIRMRRCRGSSPAAGSGAAEAPGVPLSLTVRAASRAQRRNRRAAWRSFRRPSRPGPRR